MKILGIDTSTHYVCLGVYDEGKIYEYTLDLERKHSSLLAVTIQRVLEYLQWKASDVDYFACGLGPGSFTGLRVGLATIKGLAWSLGKPVVGVSTLDIIARNAACLPGGYVVPVVDAKRSLIYSALYKATKSGLKRQSAYMLLTEKDLCRKIKSGSVMLGDALSVYKDGFLQSGHKVKLLDKDYWFPKAQHLIALALEEIKAKRLSDAVKIEPIYLYSKECQIKKKNAK